MGRLFLALFVAGLIGLLLYINRPSSNELNKFTAAEANKISNQNYKGSLHNRVQKSCLKEAINYIKQNAQDGWRSVIISQNKICQTHRTVETIPHLIKELQAKNFIVERTSNEIKISW